MTHESLGPAPTRGPEVRRVLELAASWYVFYFLNLYGFAKILGGQFYTPDRIPAEVAAAPLGHRLRSRLDLHGPLVRLP